MDIKDAIETLLGHIEGKRKIVEHRRRKLNQMCQEEFGPSDSDTGQALLQQGVVMLMFLAYRAAEQIGEEKKDEIEGLAHSACHGMVDEAISLARAAEKSYMKTRTPVPKVDPDAPVH